MTIEKRKVVEARRTITDQIAASFLPLERSAHETATHAALCVAALLDGHSAAALPPTAGAGALELISEAARLAAMSRNKIVQAHELLRDMPAEFHLPVASEPECPPNEGGGRVFSLPFGQGV